MSITAWQVVKIFIPKGVAIGAASFMFGQFGLYSGQTDDHGKFSMHTEGLKLVMYCTM